MANSTPHSRRNPTVPYELVGPELEVRIWDQFFPTAKAFELFQAIQSTSQWRQDQIKMFGRSVTIPRLQAWYGDPGARYTYSGLPMDPLQWSQPLLEVRRCLEEELNQKFNSVLLNLYRDGADCMGWHRDNEPELGPNPVIASISLGACRPFLMRHRERRQNGEKSRRVVLQPGSLLVMSGQTQSFWEHSLPRVAASKGTGPRINLTFRLIRER